jgi:hypothetical protein
VAEAPSPKIVIRGESPFAGTWEVKSWKPKSHHFDVSVPDAAVVALASEAKSPLTTDPAEASGWEKDTAFTSVPQSMWWCITTLTTVGYGDMYPTGVWGRLIAAATMLCGLVLFGMLMNIVGKAMMVALFGTDQLEENAKAAAEDMATGIPWDPRWRHCPTCGQASCHEQAQVEKNEA